MHMQSKTLGIPRQCINITYECMGECATHNMAEYCRLLNKSQLLIGRCITEAVVISSNRIIEFCYRNNQRSETHT